MPAQKCNLANIYWVWLELPSLEGMHNTVPFHAEGLYTLENATRKHENQLSGSTADFSDPLLTSRLRPDDEWHLFALVTE